MLLLPWFSAVLPILSAMVCLIWVSEAPVFTISGIFSVWLKFRKILVKMKKMKNVLTLVCNFLGFWNLPGPFQEFVLFSCQINFMVNCVSKTKLQHVAPQISCLFGICTFSLWPLFFILWFLCLVVLVQNRSKCLEAQPLYFPQVMF